MKLKVAVITLRAEDVKKAVRFYEKILGMPVSGGDSDSVVHLEVDGIYLTIMKGTPDRVMNSAIPRFPVVAFSVDDLENAVRMLIDNNVDLPWGIEKSPAAKWVMLNDPAGNLIELVEFL